MFSRALTVHKGVSNAVAVRVLGPTYFQRSETTTTAPAVADASKPFDLVAHREKVAALLKQELPKPYDGPERDLVNFPRRVRPDTPGKVRMAFLPEEWFTFFYKKTGVTGPYLFGTGLLTFLLSKELYVIEHEFSTGCAIFLLVYIAVKKFGPAARKYLDDDFAANIARMNKHKEDNMKEIENSIEQEKKNIWHAEGQKILMEAKRENVQMQLETEYRRRMMHVYEQVKKRLDYQLDITNTKRKLEQGHMVDWIVNNVVKSITPQQEKEALQKCIEDLKVISAKTH
ncbi:ATP synthase subunit b, mitochondrial [Caerostris darwini]|uniref:ATP synthase subunit b n=1 Tax=Caerostris darwini TaxID=1538125 RepID=A0AAV4TQF6_9ARAC|nr:ATP synthase subunit b, mitochondrial [Caerostris darwini]